MDIHSLITTRLLNQRRNNFNNIQLDSTRSSSPTATTSTTSTTSTSPTPTVIPAIQLSIPASPLFNPEALSTGLSLLNMSINSDMFSNNSANSKQFIGQSIAQIINSILDDTTIHSIFNSLNDETKLKIMDLYLSNDGLVNQIKYNHHLQQHKNTTKNNNNTPTNPPLDHLIYTLIHALYTFSVLLYTKFAIPILTSFWQAFLTLNEQYNIMDIVLAQLVNLLSLMIRLMLSLIVQCTNVIESQK